MTIRKYYAVRCDTEDTLVNVWALSEPTVCPNDAGHTIGKIKLVNENESPSALVTAVVSSISEEGNYASISQAFADGNSSVFVKAGTYVESSDIMLPNMGKLIGETLGAVTIVLLGGASIKIDGSNGIKETVGTIDVSHESTTVTGNGTTFTNLSAGQFILIGNNYFGIASITNDTSLELSDTYRGKSQTGANYVAQAMYTGVIMENLVVAGSSGTGLFCRGVRFCHVHDVALSQNTVNLEIQDVGDCGFEAMSIQHATLGPGVRIRNSVDILFAHCNVYNNVGHGIEILDASNNLSFDACSVSCNDLCGFLFDSNSNHISITDGNCKQNASHGIHTLSSATHIVITSLSISSNDKGVCVESDGMTISACNICFNSAGIETTASGTTSITNCVVSENEGNGISIHGNDSIIIGTQLKDNTGKGLLVTGDNNIVSGNRIMTSQDTGLEISGTASNTLVSSNVGTGNTGSNFVDSGTGTMTTANIF